MLPVAKQLAFSRNCYKKQHKQYYGKHILTTST